MPENTQNNTYRIAFFGTDTFSVHVLEELVQSGITPQVIITAPDRPQGRGLKLTPPPAKVWAQEHAIPVLQPEKLDDAFVAELGTNWDVFALASYGQIVRKNVLDIPKHGTLNVHPSLLPLYRGATPIESAMLDDAKETGVTVMLMDDKVDHGPILAQEFVIFNEWPQKPVVAEQLARRGGQLLAETIPAWMQGDIIEQEQDHSQATFTKKITKADGEISLDDDPYQNFLKIQAFTPWPGAFFFAEKDGKKIRVKITEASFTNNTLTIEKVIPEGKKEQIYAAFKEVQ